MENVLLYGPGGASPVNVGSWLLADPGPDYGARGLVQAVEAETFGDGGIFVYDRAPIRKMAFPLMPASGGAGLSLTQLESLLRFNARPGGYIDVQPDGVPSAEAVRFDIVHGRWEPAHSIPINRAFRRPGTLYLDTQPWGYWPTWITLASVASWGIPTVLPFTGVFVGDAPGLVQLVVQPTVGAPMPSGVSTSIVDGIAWGLSGSPSFTPWLRAASWVLPGDTRLTSGAATLLQSASALPYSEYQRILALANASAWGLLAKYPLPANLAPAFNGNYRVFAIGLADNPGFLAIDVAGAQEAALGSAGQQATVFSYYNNGAGVGSVTFGMPLYDLGQISLPYAGSGVASSDATLRIWARTATHTLNATGFLSFGGVFLAPIDSAGGVLARGMFLQSEFGTSSQARFVLDAQARCAWAASPAANLTAQQVIQRDLRGNYYGAMPQVTGSAAGVCMFPFARIASGVASTVPPGVLSGNEAAAISIRLQPRFQFLKGL